MPEKSGSGMNWLSRWFHRLKKRYDQWLSSLPLLVQLLVTLVVCAVIVLVGSGFIVGFVFLLAYIKAPIGLMIIIFAILGFFATNARVNSLVEGRKVFREKLKTAIDERLQQTR